MLDNKTENRPWGNFTSILEEDDCKVKTIVINPGQSISYQYHNKRNEHWILIRGAGELTINDSITSVKPGDHVYIPVNHKHKIKNVGTDNLFFIEVQTGDYFGEDDIVRLSDDYGRA